MSFIIKKQSGRYLHKNGIHSTMEPSNAKTFLTRNLAHMFINDPSLGTNVYLSPQDHIDKVWEKWTIHELTVTYTVSEAL